MTRAETRAFRAGSGSVDGIDPDDEDMVDAALLAMPDGMGGTFWRPSSLDDIYALPDRTLRLFMAYRAGMASAANKEAPAAKTGAIGGKKLA